MVTIKSLLDLAQKSLAGVAERPRREGEILLAHCLDKDMVWVMTHEDTAVEQEPFISLLKRRANHEPLEYITAKVSFYSEQFYIAPGALIPRPETEILIDKVLGSVPSDFSGHIVEVGVGSGVISIILALKLPQAHITAVDISNDALEIARLNVMKFNLDDRITLIESDLLNGIKEPIDILVSNPPYIEEELILPQSLAYEPQNALFGGKVGDELLKKLILQAKERNIPLVACEMGYDQKASIEQFVRQNTDYNVTFYEDLASLDRGFILRKKNA